MLLFIDDKFAVCNYYPRQPVCEGMCIGCWSIAYILANPINVKSNLVHASIGPRRLSNIRR